MAGVNGCWHDLCISSDCTSRSTLHVDATGQTFRQGAQDDSPTMGERLLSAAELREMPTLATGEAEDLKIDEGDLRIWLSRCGVEDGEPYADKVTVEGLKDGKWVTTQEYAG